MSEEANGNQIVIETQAEASSDKKERVKKPSRPEDEAYKRKIDALQQTINQSKAKIEKIKQTLDDRRGGRSKGSGEQQVVKNKLAELRTQFQSLLKQKQHLRDQMDAAIKTRESVKASLRDLRATMKFTTVEEIDEHIETLEQRMQHSTLSLTEEKRILEDIRKLKASRATVGQYSEKLESLSADDSTRTDIQAGIKALDEQLNGIKTQEEALRSQLTELRSKDQETQNDVPQLLQEREELKEVSKQAYEKIKELRAEQDVKWQEFKAQEKLWRAQQQEDRKARQEKIAAERAARAAERAARDAENAPEPFDREVTMCEQLVSYLSKYVDDGASGSQEEEKKEVASLEGLKPLQKKKDDEDEWMLGRGKGGKGKGKAKKAEEKKPEKLTHTFDILEAFSALKVTVPATAANVPAVLEEVTTKKEQYLQKRAEAKEKGTTEATTAETAATDTNDSEATGTSAPDADSSNPSDVAATSTATGSKKKGKKAAPDTPALKLDDSASWPAVGADAPAENGAAAAPAEDSQDDEMEEGEIREPPPSTADSIDNNSGKALPLVSFTVNGDSVSVKINPVD